MDIIRFIIFISFAFLLTNCYTTDNRIQSSNLDNLQSGENTGFAVVKVYKSDSSSLNTDIWEVLEIKSRYFIVENTSSYTAGNLTIKISIPSELQVVNLPSECFEENLVILCNIGDIPGFEFKEFKVDFKAIRQTTNLNFTISKDSPDISPSDLLEIENIPEEEIGFSPYDYNRDGIIDFNDVNDFMTDLRNQPAEPGDPLDFDGDGFYTVLDSRSLVFKCPMERCATY